MREAESKVESRPGATASAGRLGIVIVEDSPELCALLAEMLTEIPGVDILGVADSEKSALELLATQTPDLAVIDLELKSGNGLNVLAQVRAQEKKGSVKTLVFSNYANSIIRNRCHMLGATAFFDKSFQMDELLDYVQAEAKGRSSKHGQ